MVADLLNGKFYTPFFYGQLYNPAIEAFLAVPFAFIGVPIPNAVICVTFILAIFPVLFLCFTIKKQYGLPFGILAITTFLLLSGQYTILSSLPRGFVTGFPFAIVGICFLLFKNNNVRILVGGILFGIGLFVNPNVILLAPLGLMLCNMPFKVWFTKFTWFFVGACVFIGLQLVSKWYCTKVNFTAVHGTYILKYSLKNCIYILQNLNSYFDRVSPIFWKFGYIYFIIFFVLCVILLKKHKWQGIAILVSLVLILLTFGLNKITESTNSVYFAGDRFFLALPYLTCFGFVLFLLHGILPKYTVTVAIICATFSGFFQIVSLPLQIKYAGNKNQNHVVRIQEMKDLKKKCKDLLTLNIELKPALIIALSGSTQDQSLVYGCKCLFPNFPPTIIPYYERRQWIIKDVIDKKLSPIVVFSYETKELNKHKNLPYAFYTKPDFKWFKNTNKTSTFLKFIGVPDSFYTRIYKIKELKLN